MLIDEKAAEAVFQQFKHVKPRLNRAAIGLLCEAYEAAKADEQLDDCREVLKWLVALKVHKDQHGKTSHYEEMQPKAWEAAKAALGIEGSFPMSIDNAKTLLDDMRTQAEYSVGVKMPIPLYERIKAYLSTKSSDQPVDISKVIYKALNGHKMIHQKIRDTDMALPLVDYLTPEGWTSINGGMEENEAIAEAIADAIAPLLKRV